VLPPFSKKTEIMDIHIPAFKENENHQTIFSYNLYGIADHIILNISKYLPINNKIPNIGSCK
jgi:hypothetical protein